MRDMLLFEILEFPHLVMLDSEKSTFIVRVKFEGDTDYNHFHSIMADSGLLKKLKTWDSKFRDLPEAEYILVDQPNDVSAKEVYGMVKNCILRHRLAKNERELKSYITVVRLNDIYVDLTESPDEDE